MKLRRLMFDPRAQQKARVIKTIHSGGCWNCPGAGSLSDLANISDGSSASVPALRQFSLKLIQ
jgi:hypothetical protein